MNKCALFLVALLAACSCDAPRAQAVHSTPKPLGKWSVRDHIFYACGYVRDMRLPPVRAIVVTCDRTMLTELDVSIIPRKDGGVTFVQPQKGVTEYVLRDSYLHVEPATNCFVVEDSANSSLFDNQKASCKGGTVMRL